MGEMISSPLERRMAAINPYFPAPRVEGYAAMETIFTSGPTPGVIAAPVRHSSADFCIW